jgi:hypothetical protein
VAIKEGNLKAVTNSPLPMPINIPQPIPDRNPKVVDPVFVITTAATQADIPTFAPTDKSIPAVRRTRVRPDAIKNKRLACLKTLSKLLVVKKASVSKDKTIQIITTTSIRKNKFFSCDEFLSSLNRLFNVIPKLYF